MQHLSFIVSLVIFLLSYLTVTAPVSPSRTTSKSLPPTSLSDLQPLGTASTTWRPRLKTAPLVAPTFSSLKPRPERWATLSLSATDTHHRIIAYRGHHCRLNPILHIAGLPRAVSAIPIGTTSSPGSSPAWASGSATAGPAAIAAGTYEGMGGGKSSACIVFDYRGIGAGSVELHREGLGTPRAVAALWNNERCEGKPYSWATMKRDKERHCAHRGVGQWRSMRVWYGSERLTDEEFGSGTISVQEKTEEQVNQNPTEDNTLGFKEAWGKTGLRKDKKEA